jgi:hypothetical protein
VIDSGLATLLITSQVLYTTLWKLSGIAPAIERSVNP